MKSYDGIESHASKILVLFLLTVDAWLALELRSRRKFAIVSKEGELSA